MKKTKLLCILQELFFKILFTLFVFRPNKIYFTASNKGFAFYRDVLLSLLWKFYSLFTSCDTYYHYHTKGVKDFVKRSINLYLTKFFLKGVNLILLSPMLESDFKDVKTYKKVLYLPNGVEDSFGSKSFENYLADKDFSNINVLYLSNMIKSKGYFEVLKLAKHFKNKNIYFHFAGGWQSSEDEEEFFNFIKENNLEKIVTFYGFVNGDQKRELFEKSHLFIFPTRYKKEAFPLSILEAFSYGLPVLSTDEGSIPYIVDEESGIVVKDLNNFSNVFEDLIKSYLNIDTAKYCRKRYLENFSLEEFEESLLRVLN